MKSLYSARLLAVVTALLASTCVVHAEEWKLVWADEFNGPAGAAPDASKWTAETGGDGWGNKEWEYYTDKAENASLDGHGCLAITARRAAPKSYHVRYGTGEFSSARLITKGKYEFQYGRVEARLKVPAGAGLWPAFWILGDNLGRAEWPRCGEVDIMEIIGREPGVNNGTMHGPGYSDAHGPTATFTLPKGGKFTDHFHVFSLEWSPGELRWLVDGQCYETRTRKDVPAKAEWVFEHPFFILLNLAVGGDWPGPPKADTIFPAQLLVDYVRVYQSRK